MVPRHIPRLSMMGWGRGGERVSVLDVGGWAREMDGVAGKGKIPSGLCRRGISAWGRTVDFAVPRPPVHLGPDGDDTVRRDAQGVHLDVR